MASDRGPALPERSGTDMTFSSITLTGEALPSTATPPNPLRKRINALIWRTKPRQDLLGGLPPYLSWFLGYRAPSLTILQETIIISPCILRKIPLHKIPLQYETYIFATLGSFISILLIEAIMSASTAFRNVYHSPSIVTSFGASAILVFGVIQAPLAQPRNFLVGQLVSAVLAISITKLWVLRDPDYVDHLGNEGIYIPGFINGALCMSLALLGQMVVGAMHPPGGATALAAATDPVIVALSWHYIPVVLVSSIIMLAWALVINNLGRRRYPMYWWSPDNAFMGEAEKELSDLEEPEGHTQKSYGRDIEAVEREMA